MNGSLLLNIATYDRMFHASFTTGPLSKTAAYAMMLNYNKEALQTLTGITFSIGEMVENGRGGNDRVEVVLSKLAGGQEAGQLGITYRSGPGEYTVVILRQMMAVLYAAKGKYFGYLHSFFLMGVYVPLSAVFL